MNLFHQRIRISFLYFYIFKFQHEFHNFFKTKSIEEKRTKDTIPDHWFLNRSRMISYEKMQVPIFLLHNLW